MGTLFILYYHRILPFEGYDISIAEFEWQLKYLKQRFNIVGLETISDTLSGKTPKENSVAITFDDGYFDNYVYAYPILKKYNTKAVIFISTSKIKHGPKRKTLIDYWNGEATLNSLKKPKEEETALYDSLKGNTDEFLLWEEIKEMTNSGIFEIGSHGHTHTKIFVSDTVIGYNRIDIKPHWSFSNISEDKSGVPVYPMKSALWGRQYLPPQNGKPGRFETEQEALLRIENELKTSRTIIRQHLQMEVYSICWPWGECSSLSIKAAKNSGFTVGFSTQKGIVTKNSNRYSLPRISASRKKNRFRKRAFIYSHSILAKIYTLFSK